MPTTKKKAAGSPAETPAEPQSMTRTAPAKPRNIAAYEAAVAEFATASELFAAGRFADAKTHFDAVAAAASAEEPILADRARTYGSICGRKVAAVPDGGEDFDSLYHRGVFAANSGRLDEALTLLDKALAQRPDDASALYARASVRGLQGRVDEAAVELKKAVALDPRFRFQAASDPDFDKVRDEAAFIDVIEPSHSGV